MKRKLPLTNRATLLTSRLKYALLLTTFLVGACDDPRPIIAPETRSFTFAAATGSDLVTSNPQALADALRAVDNQNEILVVYKDADAPGISVDALRDQDDLIVGVPADAQRVRARERAFAPAGPDARSTILEALAAHGITPYRQMVTFPILAIRVPDKHLVPVLTTLLNHSNVDFVEANQRRPTSLDASTVGSNPTDYKHSFHNITAAWDYTRGSGAKVGVLDTGFAYDHSTGTWHPDGGYYLYPISWSTTAYVGIEKKGFVDDYPQHLANCGQYDGTCVPWDDHSHGTAMAGIVAANDNDLGGVGVMPEGAAFSMKIIQNDFVSGNGCGGTRTDCIEDDDFVAGIDWATRNGIRVLSMSFSSQFGSSVFTALKSAYYDHDILLLSSTGNVSEQNCYEPQEFNFVMGVAGLHADGSNYGQQGCKEVAAYSGGTTTHAYCPGSDFCVPDGWVTPIAPNGGTSASTAIVAGIAGLLRGYRPGETAPQIWNRLVATSGVNGRVDAWAAITY